MSSDDNPVTQLLMQWRSGDDEALDQLMPLMYEELRGIARQRMKFERNNHTLQPTGLANEAYKRLIDVEVDWKDRAHFLAVASSVMRRLLIDHARGQKRKKRDGGLRVTLDEAHAIGDQPDVQVLDLHAALEALAEIDERKSRMIELQYFGGLSAREIAVVTGVSRPTVERDVRFAKAWLRSYLAETAAEEES